MSSTIYRYDGAEFLGNTPQASPAVGAFVSPPRNRSAVVSEMTQLLEQDTAEVPVSDAGGLVAGDVLRVVGRDYPDYQLFVVSMNIPQMKLTLQNYGAFIALAVGEQLLPTADVPVLYRDANLTHSYGDVLPRTDSAGRWEFYAAEPTLDIMVLGGGLASTVLYSSRAGFRLARANSHLDARDYPSIQDTIDALPPEGGTVFIPAGIWNLTQALYTPCDRPCHLLGEGSNHEGDKGTVLVWTTNTGMLRVRGSDSSVRNMVLRNDSGGASSAEHEGYGIFVGRRGIVDAHPHPGTSTTDTEYVKGSRHPLRTVHIEDVVVLGAPGWGLTIPGHGFTQTEAEEHGRVVPSATEEGTLSFWIHVNRTKIIGSKTYGGIFAGTGCTTLYFDGGACLYHGEGQGSTTSRYAYVRGVSQLSFERWTFEGASPHGTSDGTGGAWVTLVACEGAVFDRVWFENDAQATGGTPGAYEPQYFILLSTRNRTVAVRNPLFARLGDNAGKLRCIYCERDGVHGVQIVQPYALSGTTPLANTGGTYVPLDPDALVFNGGSSGSSDNSQVVLLGEGFVEPRPEVIPGPSSPPVRSVLTRSAVPPAAQIVGSIAPRIPESAQDQRVGSNPANDEMWSLGGGLAFEELVPGESQTRALVYSSGDPERWRLINNVPTVEVSPNESVPDLHHWSIGDLVVVSDSPDPKLLIRVAAGWRVVGSLGQEWPSS